MYRSRCRSDSNSTHLRMLCCTWPCRSPQKLSFSSLTKCWKCSVIGVTFAMGVSLLVRMASASQAKPTYTLSLFTQSKLTHLISVALCACAGDGPFQCPYSVFTDNQVGQGLARRVSSPHSRVSPHLLPSIEE